MRCLFLVVSFVDCSFVTIGSVLFAHVFCCYTCLCCFLIVAFCYVRLGCACSCFCILCVRYCFGGPHFVLVGPNVVFVRVACFGCLFC